MTVTAIVRRFELIEVFQANSLEAVLAVVAGFMAANHPGKGFTVEIEY